MFVLSSFSDDVFLSFTFYPLPSPLPWGEGKDCRKSDNGRFQHHHSLFVEEGQIAENLIMVGFSTIIPSPRGRGLGRGQNLKMHRIVFSDGKSTDKF